MPNIIYGGFTKRMFAFWVDMLVGTAIAMIILGILGLAIGAISSKVVAGIVTLVILLYFTLMTYFNDGQTLGKMIFGLKVVSITDQKLTFINVVIREFVGRYIHMFSFLFLLYIITAFTAKKQNVSDFFADTSVIDLKRFACYEAGELNFSENHPQMDETVETV